MPGKQKVLLFHALWTCGVLHGLWEKHEAVSFMSEPHSGDAKSILLIRARRVIRTPLNRSRLQLRMTVCKPVCTL